MNPKDAGKVVTAGLLELMPVRNCSACESPVELPGHTEFLPMTDKAGAVVLFFCGRCARPRAEA